MTVNVQAWLDLASDLQAGKEYLEMDRLNQDLEALGCERDIYQARVMLQDKASNMADALDEDLSNLNKIVDFKYD